MLSNISCSEDVNRDSNWVENYAVGNRMTNQNKIQKPVRQSKVSIFTLIAS